MPAQGTSTGGRNGGGRGKYRQANKQLSDSLREACPPHKLDDLELLIKELKGDEEKIRERISEWWDEPVTQPTEGEWEDVNKKGTVVKKKDFKQQPRGGRGDGRGRGRGGPVGGREGRGRGHGGEPSRSDHKKQEQKSSGNKSESHNGRLHGNPPVESVRVPQGAWAKKSEPAAPPVDVVHTIDVPSEGDVPTSDVPAPVPVPPKPIAAGPAGNVWATKGSAHLIRAEKPTPPPPPAVPAVPAIAPPATRAPVAPISRTITKERSPKVASTQPPPELVSGIHATSLLEQEKVVPFSSTPSETQPILETGTSKTWSSATAGPDTSQSPIESPTSPVLNKTVGSGPISVAPPITSLPIPSVPEVPVPEPPATVPKPQEPKIAAPTSFINMGHWENEDNDDTNLDFGFGTFDLPPTSNEATASAVNATNASPSTAPETSHTTNQPPAASASPARPPPGLTIGGGGMPPIPPNAVLVHELENKLEQVTLDTSAKQSNVAPEKQITGIQAQNSNPVSQDLPGQVPGIHNPYSSTSQYGMGVGYNYGGPATSAVNAFVGMPGPGAPVLGTQQQPLQTKPPQPTGGPLQPAGSGLYGTPHSGQSTSAVAGNTVVGGSSDAAPPTSAGIPPGMPNPGMPYGNVYYGQQPPFHMGHNQGGIGYNYYGTQFGGVQGFGYPQNIGQNSGYGHGPYHDDTVVAGSHTHQPQASGGGYQQQPKNNSGAYRGGRNSHHANNNQYQQSHQYNPQQHLQGGYGGQPYGMGYHGDHFNQRGGYGGMQDPYGMQPQQPQGAGSYGFQSDDQYKGKSKGGRGGGLQHFQQQVQVPPQQLSGQQGFGLQGQGASESNQTSGGGWSNQHSNSGWNTGAASWQQK